MFDDPTIILTIVGTFLLAGVVKGVIGLGLPTISLAILTVSLDLSSAMALLLIPSFVTNLLQGAAGGHAGMLFRRLWPFMLAATLTIFIGGQVFAALDHAWLAMLLGALIMTYGAISLAGWRPSISRSQARWLGPLTGVVNGVLTGMTGSFVVPGVIYLNALGLERDALVQAMGILFTLATLALAISLGGSGFLTAELGAGSLLGLPPALAGMWAGQRLRRKLSPQGFRRTFFTALLGLGLYIVLTNG